MRLIIYAVLLLIFCLIDMTGTCFAAPQINSLTGTVQNGSVITISGTGFGENGPNVVLFDDFENGTNGSIIPTNSAAAKVGDWVGRAYETWPKYSNAYKVSGNLAWKSDMSAHYRQDLWPSFSENRYVFVSWWQFIPLGTVYPGDGDAYGVNWKTIWIQHDNSTVDNDMIPIFLGIGAGGTIDDLVLGGNDGRYSKWTGVGDIQGKGTWKRYGWYMYGGASSDGVVKFWQGGNQLVNDSGVTVLKDTNGWTDVHVNGYGRQTDNCTPYYDDVYIAVGPYAQARIEIGNVPTYAASTNLTVLTPTSWSATSIVGTVRQGAFLNGSTAYLYVIDASGNVSDQDTSNPGNQGFPIIFGSGSAVTAPAAPAGLTVE